MSPPGSACRARCSPSYVVRGDQAAVEEGGGGGDGLGDQAAGVAAQVEDDPGAGGGAGHGVPYEVAGALGEGGDLDHGDAAGEFAVRSRTRWTAAPGAGSRSTRACRVPGPGRRPYRRRRRWRRRGVRRRPRSPAGRRRARRRRCAAGRPGGSRRRAAGEPARTRVTSIRPSRSRRAHRPTPVYWPSRASSNSSYSPGEYTAPQRSPLRLTARSAASTGDLPSAMASAAASATSSLVARRSGGPGACGSGKADFRLGGAETSRSRRRRRGRSRRPTSGPPRGGCGGADRTGRGLTCR